MHPHYVSIQENDAGQKPELSTLKLIFLTISFLGVQFGWAIQMAFTTPIFLELGVSHFAISFIWLAGPISGLVVQPIVGAISDGYYTRFGRRAPFIFSGGICIIIGLALISNATLLASAMGLDKKDNTAAIVIAVIGFWVLDLSNNTVQGPCRALLVDVAPPQQQATGSALFSFMLGFGNLLGYFTGYLNLLKYLPFFGTQYRALFTISMIVLATCLSVTLLSTAETVLPTRGIENPFKTIYVGINNMPPVVSRVCAVQFFSWIGWFTFILFITDWVGEAVFKGDPYAEEGTPTRAAFDSGVRHGALALSWNAAVTMVMSVILPKLVNLVGIKVVFFMSQMILAACLISTYWVTTVHAAQAIILVCGIPWAVTMALPFSIVGEGVSSRESGLYMGALNIFVVVPQIMVSVFIPFVIALFNHNVVAALVAGGFSSIIAAFFALRLIKPVPPIEEIRVIDGGDGREEGMNFDEASRINAPQPSSSSPSASSSSPNYGALPVKD